MDTPPRPFEVNASLDSDPDPTSRALVLGDALNAIPDFQRWLRQARQRAVIEMTNAGMSYREVGKKLGVSHARVQQILMGLSDGHHAAKAERPTPVEDQAPDTADI